MSENAAETNAPTDAMLKWAGDLAKTLDETLPDEVKSNFEACRDYIDKNKDLVPPTKKQLDLAEKLSEEKGIEITDSARKLKTEMGKWLDMALKE